jgi:hypothetical protein
MMVTGLRLRLLVAALLQHARRRLDVDEQERDGAMRERHV